MSLQIIYYLFLLFQFYLYTTDINQQNQLIMLTFWLAYSGFLPAIFLACKPG